MLSVYWVFLLELVFVAALDIRTRKIPNEIVAINFLLIFFTWEQSQVEHIGEFLLMPLITLMLGFGLFLLRLVGAGDCKLVVSILVNLSYLDQRAFLEQLAKVTILFSIVYLMIKSWNRRSELLRLFGSRQYVTALKQVRGDTAFAPVVLLAWIKYGLI